MGLASKKWRLTPGDEYSIKYRVDDGRPDSVIAKAADNQTTRFKDNADLFNAFRRGRTLHVRVQSTDLAFNITNTSLILDFLQKCVASGGNFDEVADKPSPSPPATGPRCVRQAKCRGGPHLRRGAPVIRSPRCLCPGRVHGSYGGSDRYVVERVRRTPIIWMRSGRVTPALIEDRDCLLKHIA